MAHVFLFTAVLAEVVATSALARSAGLTRPGPTLVTALGYAIAFWCLAQSLLTIPVGVAYAFWSGLGIVAITLIAWLVYDQRLDAPALLGIGLILAGVLVIHLFSETTGS